MLLFVVLAERDQMKDAAHHLYHKQHQSLELKDWTSQNQSPFCLLSNAKSKTTT